MAMGSKWCGFRLTMELCDEVIENCEIWEIYFDLNASIFCGFSIGLSQLVFGPLITFKSCGEMVKLISSQIFVFMMVLRTKGGISSRFSFFSTRIRSDTFMRFGEGLKFSYVKVITPIYDFLSDIFL